MEQKLIRVYRDETSDLERYLSTGWVISQISASACAGNSIHSYCYVVITKGAQPLKTDE